MEDFKTLFITTFSAIAAYFSPIYGLCISASTVFLLKIIVGYITSKSVDKEDFSFKKAFETFREACTFFVLISCTFFVGEHMDNKSGAIQSISMVTYALIYFVALNIFKNLKRLYPDCQWIAFVYYILSIEFIKKVSFMESFLKQKEVQNGKD